MSANFFQCANKTGYCGLAQWYRSVPSRACRFQLNPARRFLGNVDVIPTLTILNTDIPPFSEQELRVSNEIEVLIHEPVSTKTPSHLFIRSSKEDNVALQWHSRTFE